MLRIFGWIVCGFLILGLGLALFMEKRRIHAFESRLEKQNRELIALQGDQQILKEYTQRTSRYMNVPPPDFAPEAVSRPEGPETGNFELAAYDAVSFLADYDRELANQRLFSDIIEGEDFQALLKREGLDFKKTSGLKGSLFSQGMDFFSLEFNLGEGSLLCQAVWDKGSCSGRPDSGELQSFIHEKNREIRQSRKKGLELNRALPGLYRDKAFRKSLKEKGLILGKLQGSLGSYAIPVLRLDLSPVFNTGTSFAKSCFIFADQQSPTLDELKNDILDYVEHHDLRSPRKIRDDLAEEELRKLYKDAAFQQRLQDLGYIPSDTPREDNDYIYYDLRDSEGHTKGALALQKGFSTFYLMDGEDVPVRSLKSFTPEHKLTFSFDMNTTAPGALSQELPMLEGREYILLIGSHEHNADTMIIMALDGPNENIKLLSIPRDLYYQGRKINSIYRHSGPAVLAAALSSITGLNITKYVGVDMYAFIDIINILDGIDVTLERALVDPTYKIRENGRWTSLYYPPGTYHLDGIAALRIARSRHTSSDFARSTRQEKVISALKEKAAAMNITDLNKLYGIIQVVEQYLDTNLTTAEMVKYVLSCRNYGMEGQYVMNTQNILYSSYTNLYALSPEEQEEALKDEDFYKGGWIVLPKENDWGIIRQFVRDCFALP